MPPRKKTKLSSASSGSAATSHDIPSRVPEGFPEFEKLSRALVQYEHAVMLRSREHSKAPNELVELDTWLNGDFLARISLPSREPVTKADMTSLMKWKLSRGKSRPTLLALIGSNSETLIHESTGAALDRVREAGDDLEVALLAIAEACKLKGVGAATASALLTLHPPHLLPFMSDEAAAFFSSTLGPIKYTDAFYKKYAAAMVACVKQLNESDVGSSMLWDCMKLEHALFAMSILSKHGEQDLLEDPVAAGGQKKRKRDSQAQ